MVGEAGKKRVLVVLSSIILLKACAMCNISQSIFSRLDVESQGARLLNPQGRASAHLSCQVSNPVGGEFAASLFVALGWMRA